MLVADDEYINKVKVVRELIVKTLRSMGFQVEVEGFVIGESGIRHKFDIVASSHNRKLAIDFVLPPKDVNIATLASCAKAIDLKDFKTVVVLPVNAKDELMFCPKQVTALFYDDVNSVIDKLGKIAES